MTAELPQLEILEMLSREDPREHEALALSRLPNLRTVNLSNSLLSDFDHDEEPRLLSWRQRRAEADFHYWRDRSVCNEAAPHIDWVHRGKCRNSTLVVMMVKNGLTTKAASPDCMWWCHR